jgi:sulfite reductase (NADPH) flavoprotein alpha-component
MIAARYSTPRVKICAPIDQRLRSNDPQTWSKDGQAIRATVLILWAGMVENLQSSAALPMSKPSLSIFYATETGNAESLAHQAHERAIAEGWSSATVQNISALKPVDLAAHTLVLFVVSTWGDPPSDATDFHYDLEKAQLDLSGLRYAVLGLGDRDYADFNGFARKLDERLSMLGASAVLARTEADLDFEDTYSKWADRIFPLIGKSIAA